MIETLFSLLLAITPAHAGDPAARPPAAAVTVDAGRVEAVDAVRPPRSASLMGASCSFKTGMMARRVVAEGDVYAYVGTLQEQDGDEVDEVSCPYRIGGDDGACVVANELVEHLAGADLAGVELSVEGRILEVDGVRYVVLTAYSPSAS